MEEKKERLQDAINRLYEKGHEHDSDEIVSLEDELNILDQDWEVHHRECLRCLDNYQHPTIQDAAKWLFKTFDPNMGVLGDRTVHAIDYEKFTTIEEVHAAWSEAREISEQGEADQRNALPIGKPNGLNVFTELESNQITSLWQTYFADEIGHNSFMKNGGYVHTLVTIDRRKGEYYVCFMQDPDTARGGRFVEYEVEALATVIINRAKLAEADNENQIAFPYVSGKYLSFIGILTSVLNKAANYFATAKGLSPDQFHFYVHHRPRHLQKEVFCEVRLEFVEGKFQRPKFHKFDVIPEIIQQAYHKTEMAELEPRSFPKLELRP